MESHKAPKKLVLFDFDGTITHKDSLIDFLNYTFGNCRFFIGLFLLAPYLLGFKLHLISNHLAKEKLLSFFFRGWEENRFQSIADQYSVNRINRIVRPSALKKIKWYKSQGHTVVVVSASIENWLKHWCECEGLDLIATQLEIVNGRLTGRFASKNCIGPEKVRRIINKYKIEDYKEIHAYGDSDGDREMLAISHKGFYRYFK